MRPRTASLEEAFLDLTDEDDAVAARAAAAPCQMSALSVICDDT